MARKLCFVVNPFAGIGGPLAEKGTSERLVREAVVKGYRLVGFERARDFASHLARIGGLGEDVILYTASGYMGEFVFKKYGSVVGNIRVVYEYRGWPTSRSDTITAIEKCVASGSEVIVFAGGDGTARDVLEGLRRGGRDVPVIGVPAGVKMFSSVFAISPRHAAIAVVEWLRGTAGICDGEVVDYDEESYRRGVLRLVFHGVVKKICSENIVGSTKDVGIGGADVEENRLAIARYIVEHMEACTLYILGPGSTVAKISELLGVENTLLGVDAVHNRSLVGKDLDEETLYRVVKSHIGRGGRVKLLLSPIGGQGFILGRGNQQISPRILRLIGRDNVIIVADKYKLRKLQGRLRVDTGDESLDEEFKGYMRVIVDYGEEYVARIE